MRQPALAGTVMGLAGVALLVGVESVQTLGEFLGSLAMIGAAAFYGLSSFVVKALQGPVLDADLVHLRSLSRAC